MRKSLRTLLLPIIMALCFVCAYGAEPSVEWSVDRLSGGELSVSVSGAEDGLRAVLAVYEGDSLVSLNIKQIENSGAELSAQVRSAENSRAKLMLWNWSTLSPAERTLSVITPEGITPEPQRYGALKVSAWVDFNGDGERGEADLPLAGADIRLTRSGEAAGAAKTDENGEFVFAELPVGEYTVEIADRDGRKAAENPRAVNVSSDGSEAAFAFEPLAGTISGTVWNDADRDGVRDDDEQPLSGVSVTVGENDTVLTTGDDGVYRFENLPPRDYMFELALPEGYICTTGNAQKELRLEEGAAVTNDVGLVENFASVSGVVWNDIDGDGIVGSDEAPIGSATVTVAAEGKTVRFARTAADGSYAFDKLLPGEYTLSVKAAEDREATGENPRVIKLEANDPQIENFGFKLLWVSDDQKVNKASSEAYHSLEPAVEGMYRISFELTLKSLGNNAIMLWDSSNKTDDAKNEALVYATSSAVLLFKENGKFAVNSGNGGGAYSGGETVLCDAVVNKPYKVVFEGDVRDNTYSVTVTGEDGLPHASGRLRARRNGAKLDTIGLISNSHKTAVSGGVRSDFSFFIKNFTLEFVTDDPAYNGFGGLYFNIKTELGRYVHGNNGALAVDWYRPQDNSAVFLPRDMGDGSFAFVCISSNRRITGAHRGGRLLSTDYTAEEMNSADQHWLLEPSENFAPDHLSYYLKNVESGVYVSQTITHLTAGDEADKIELLFEPLPDGEQTPLRRISLTESYAGLTRAQRARLERIYESVAGDAFDRYSPTGTDYTFRNRLDTVFNRVLDEGLSADEGRDKIVNWFFVKPHGEDGSDSFNAGKFLIADGAISNSYTTSAIPSTAGTVVTQGEGTDGSYEFWGGSGFEKGTSYPLTITDAEGNVQRLTLYVQDNGTARGNAETFKEAIKGVPYIYRKNITSVKVRSDTANNYNCGRTDLYIRLAWNPSKASMLCTLFHELSHSIDQSNGNWSQGDGWGQAIADDMFIVSPYADSTEWEDFAEFGRLYFISYNCRDRERAMQIIFPNRYASYWRLRNNQLGGFSLWDDEEYME